MATALIAGIGTSASSLNLQLQTPATPPWIAPASSVILTGIAFGLSIGAMRKEAGKGG